MLSLLKNKENATFCLLFCFFYVRSTNATDHFHDNMRYSRDKDNRMAVEKISPYLFFSQIYLKRETADVSDDDDQWGCFAQICSIARGVTEESFSSESSQTVFLFFCFLLKFNHRTVDEDPRE